MDGSDGARSIAQTQAEAYDGPPDHRVGARHEVYPELSHDEIERFNFLAQMNRHLQTKVIPLVESTWDNRIEPRFEAKHGATPQDRHEARKELLTDPVFQTWSALKRMTMEQRQQAGRWAAIRQAETLAAKAEALVREGQLSLDPALPIPRYVSAVDHHCMPGSYHTELFPGDVSGSANYDCGLHVTVGGRGGAYNDGIGTQLASWVKEAFPDFKPSRILDLGTTTGHNLLPVARAFPDAEVIGIDVGTPVLRYAAARAAALGVDNVRFVQADATDLSRFDDGSFDFVMSTMFLHELSLASMDAILREAHRLLAPGGLLLNMEQPAYKGMPVFEQAMRDWDAFYNNEPYWTTLHGLDLDEHFVAAGFPRDRLVYTAFPSPPGAGRGRKIGMVFTGARKEAA
ncbi:class I SAM-dependent methyltransferase [Phenylobacterium sp.]|uniref:class I SAM-dependent methyltransferase n=1 Tax=Phenylobacterium sp. TaxID=1871053 RepID=UPI0039837B65